MLRDNYFQNQSLSVSRALAPSLLDAQYRFIKQLEKAGRLSRELESLPNDEEFEERAPRDWVSLRPSARCSSHIRRSA